MIARDAHPAGSRSDLARPLTVRVREACRLTGIGRSKLYELIADGEIETLKIGASTFIPMGSLEALIDRRLRDRPLSR